MKASWQAYMASLLSNITIEPFYFLFFLSISLASSGTGLLYPVKVCQEDFQDYLWYSDKLHILGQTFRHGVEQRIVCLKLEDNEYLDVIREFFGPDCDSGRGVNVTITPDPNNPDFTLPFCDIFGGNVTASENPLLDDVQKRVSDISSVALGIQFFPAAISTFFLVNAADLIGRKKLFIIPLFGYLLYNLSFLCNWFIAGSSWWMIFAAVHEFLGGRHVITVVGVLYITDITTVENRTRRLNILGLLGLFGSGAGTFLAGFILDAKNVIGFPNSENISEQTEFVYNGFTSVYVLASILTIGCILQIIFFVKESRPSSQGDVTLARILSTESQKKSINTVMRNRHDGSRGIILCLCVAYFFVAVSYAGIYLSGTLWHFFQKLSWEFSEYTSYVGGTSAMVLVGCTTLVPFLLVKARLQDMTLALLATLSSIINYAIIFCTPYNNHWVPYLGFPVNLLTGIVATCIKSTLTKVVEPKDVTQVLLRLLLFLLILFPFMFSAPVSAFSRPSECISTKKPP